MSVLAKTKVVTLDDGKKVTIRKLDQGGKFEFSELLKNSMEEETIKSGTTLRRRAAKMYEEAKALGEVEDNPATPRDKSIEAGKKRLATVVEARTLEKLSVDILKDFNRDCSAKMYDFHGTACDEALATKYGLYQVAWIMMKADQPEFKTVDDLISIMCYETHPDNYEKIQSAVLNLMELTRNDEKNAGPSGSESSATSGPNSSTPEATPTPKETETAAATAAPGSASNG